MSQSVYERVKAILNETPLADQKQRASNDHEVLKAMVECAAEMLDFDPFETDMLYIDICVAVSSKLLRHYKDKCEHESTD